MFLSFEHLYTFHVEKEKKIIRNYKILMPEGQNRTAAVHLI